MHRPSLRNERLAFLFIVGLLVFNPPILTIFDKTVSSFGIPLLYLYLFISWTCLIALAAFAIEWTAAADDGQDGASGEQSASERGP